MFKCSYVQHPASVSSFSDVQGQLWHVLALAATAWPQQAANIIINIVMITAVIVIIVIVIIIIINITTNTSTTTIIIIIIIFTNVNAKLLVTYNLATLGGAVQAVSDVDFLIFLTTLVYHSYELPRRISLACFNFLVLPVLSVSNRSTRQVRVSTAHTTHRSTTNFESVRKEENIKKRILNLRLVLFTNFLFLCEKNNNNDDNNSKKDNKA